MRFPFCWAKRPDTEIEPGVIRLPRVPPNVYHRLEALGQARGATLFMTLLAGLNAWLWHLTGSADILVGANVNQQDLPEMEGVVGPTSNLVGLRTGLSGNPTFLELLDRVCQVTIDAFAHQEMPFEEVVAALASSGVAPPAIQIIFQVTKGDARPLLQLPGVRVRGKDIARMRRGFWGLTISLRAGERHLMPAAAFDNNLYDPRAVRLALTRYCALLARVAEHSERRLSEYFG